MREQVQDEFGIFVFPPLVESSSVESDLGSNVTPTVSTWHCRSHYTFLSPSFPRCKMEIRTHLTGSLNDITYVKCLLECLAHYRPSSNTSLQFLCLSLPDALITPSIS